MRDETKMFFGLITHNSRIKLKLNMQDDLNGLFLTSSLFHKRLQQERLRSERSKQPLSLVTIDLKQLLEIINRRVGMSQRHVLQYFGHTIKTMTRACDRKGWLGKEEIAILTPDTAIAYGKKCSSASLSIPLKRNTVILLKIEDSIL